MYESKATIERPSVPAPIMENVHKALGMRTKEEPVRVPIEWGNFPVKYWKPTLGTLHTLTIANWGMEKTTYGGKYPESWVLAVSIKQADNATYDPSSMPSFSSAAASFVEGIRPVIERANQEGRGHATIQFECKSKDEYWIKEVVL